MSKKLTDEVHEYIDDHYVDARPDRRRKLAEADYMMLTIDEMISKPTLAAPSGSEFIAEQSFAQVMTKYINSHHMTDPEVYKRANITKQNYYKIKTERCLPKKSTALALCVSMKLDP